MFVHANLSCMHANIPIPLVCGSAYKKTRSLVTNYQGKN